MRRRPERSGEYYPSPRREGDAVPRGRRPKGGAKKAGYNTQMARKQKYQSRKDAKIKVRAGRTYRNKLSKPSNICKCPITYVVNDTCMMVNSSAPGNLGNGRVAEIAIAPTGRVQSLGEYILMSKLYDNFRFKSITF